MDAIVDVPTFISLLRPSKMSRVKRSGYFLMSGPASSDLTGKACSPYGIQWTYDTYALAHGTGGAIVKQGGTSWFFITADYAFGHAPMRSRPRAAQYSEPCGLHSTLRIFSHIRSISVVDPEWQV